MTSHPFSICSLPVPTSSSPNPETDMVFYIKAGDGFTARLASKARETPGTSLQVFIDGPYGGLTIGTLAKFDKAILIAGGSGAGLTLPIIQDWILRRDEEQRLKPSGEKDYDDQEALPELRIIVVSRRVDTVAWYDEELGKIQSQVTKRTWRSIHVSTYCTNVEAGEYASSEEHIQSMSMPDSEIKDTSKEEAKPLQPRRSSCNKLQLQLQRPDLPRIIENETACPGRSVGIVVCGPKSMDHDVRNAVAEAQARILKGKAVASEVYMHSEPFSW